MEAPLREEWFTSLGSEIYTALSEALDPGAPNAASFCFQLPRWMACAAQPLQSSASSLNTNHKRTAPSVTINNAPERQRTGMSRVWSQRDSGSRGCLGDRPWGFFVIICCFNQVVRYNLHIVKLTKVWYLELYLSIIRGRNYATQSGNLDPVPTPLLSPPFPCHLISLNSSWPLL